MMLTRISRDILAAIVIEGDLREYTGRTAVAQLQTGINEYTVYRGVLEARGKTLYLRLDKPGTFFGLTLVPLAGPEYNNYVAMNLGGLSIEPHPIFAAA